MPVRASSTPLSSYVSPFIGTSGGGNTYPGVVTPFGMAQFSPDEAGTTTGYDYLKTAIDGFSLVHMSGVGCTGYGDVFLTPTTGPIDVTHYGSPFSHSRETASPGYYQVFLDRYGINVEITATEHCGLARLTFPTGVPANLLIPISHTLTTSHRAKLTIVDSRTVEGSVTSGSFCDTGEIHTVYFVMRLDKPFASCGTFINGKITLLPSEKRAGSGEGTGARGTVDQTADKTSVGAYLTFPASTSSVQAAIGISYVDIDGARRNLDAEVGHRSFDAIRARAAGTWENELHRIDMTPIGGHDDYVKFYTALYHSLLMPSVFSDVDGRYIGFDDKIHTVRAGHAVYTNFSGWDIYRSEFTLLCLIEPRRAQDMCESIALMARQLGHIDRWPTANQPTEEMNGDPLSSIVTTAWDLGLHDFDVRSAYAAMSRSQAVTDDFDRIGYIPGDVSSTEEYAYAFWAVSRLAEALGKTADARAFARRALDYRNLLNVESRFMQPRDKSGAWPPFTGTQEDGFREGSGWQYIWLAPQDVRGLIAGLGGDDAFNAKLESFFAHPPKRWDDRYYNPENEVDLEAPFLYNWSGEPWKTQSTVRELLADVYYTTPNGIPGNDDCGEMSSWYILGALGIYPTDPARPAVEIFSPIVRKAVIHLSSPYNGKTAIVETAGSGPYVRAVTVDGKPWPRDWMPLDVLTHGGTLNIDLADKPNRAWGTAPANRPPSMSDAHPLTVAPHIETSGFVGGKVSMHDSEPKAAIYYTVDGARPSAKSHRYVGPFAAVCGTVYAVAIAPGHAPSLVADVFVSRPLPPSDGTGLSATYFSKIDLSGSTVTRIDPAVDFGWPNGSPAKGIGPENFSARWVGQIKAPYTGEYTLSTISDDGIRVWIDGRLVIDDWTDHSPKPDQTRVSMLAGRKYSIKIEYFNHTDGDACQLMWSAPFLASAVVPAAYLYPDMTPGH